MKLIPKLTDTVEVMHDGKKWRRYQYDDGTYRWEYGWATYIYRPPPDILEIEYQKLINKPVTTTNEQPNLDLFDLCKEIGCGSHSKPILTGSVCKTSDEDAPVRIKMHINNVLREININLYPNGTYSLK